eukprot:11168863-Lingulodinium_polyedra.AAC.1
MPGPVMPGSPPSQRMCATQGIHHPVARVSSLVAPHPQPHPGQLETLPPGILGSGYRRPEGRPPAHRWSK